jgi:hypothetical protein
LIRLQKQLAFQQYYNYQRFDRDRLLTVIRDKKLYFSDPLGFNDPWDCKPWFNFQPMLEDPVKRQQMVAFFRTLVSQDMLAHPFRKIYDQSILSDDETLKNEIEVFSRNLADQIRRFRVYCLSTDPLSTLMWSHYADNHHGVCLEFNKNNPLIEKARPVRYTDTYPEWTPQGSIEDVPVLVLTKAKEWCYEREFRIMGSPTGGPAKLDGEFVSLPNGALTGIIIGCESHNQGEIVDLAKEHAPELAIKRMVRVPNHYKLQVSVLNGAQRAASSA